MTFLGITHSFQSTTSPDQRRIENKPPRLANGRKSVVYSLLVAIFFALLVWGPGSILASADEVTYPVADFQDGKVRHFTFKSNDGLTIKYFLLKASDGKIRAAIDACEVCWPAGKGYSQSGDNVICNNCGLKFPSKKIGDIRGGCNPHPLKIDVKNNQVIIKTADLLEGRRFFDLKR